jgi:hypothetical protein
MEAQYRLYILSSADAQYRRISGRTPPPGLPTPSLGSSVFKASEGGFR